MCCGGQKHYILHESKNSIDTILYKYQQCNCAETYQELLGEVECVVVSKPFPQVRLPFAGQLLSYSLTLLEQGLGGLYTHIF